MTWIDVARRSQREHGIRRKRLEPARDRFHEMAREKEIRFALERVAEDEREQLESSISTIPRPFADLPDLDLDQGLNIARAEIHQARKEIGSLQDQNRVELEKVFAPPDLITLLKDIE